MFEELDRAASGAGSYALGTDKRPAREVADSIEWALRLLRPHRADEGERPARRPDYARARCSARGFTSYLEALRDLLAEGWEVRGKEKGRLLATLVLALDFHTWRSLERGSGLSRQEAVEDRARGGALFCAKPIEPPRETL